jgi:hypothetical protein
MAVSVFVVAAEDVAGRAPVLGGQSGRTVVTAPAGSTGRLVAASSFLDEHGVPSKTRIARIGVK